MRYIEKRSLCTYISSVAKYTVIYGQDTEYILHKKPLPIFFNKECAKNLSLNNRKLVSSPKSFSFPGHLT